MFETSKPFRLRLQFGPHQPSARSSLDGLSEAGQPQIGVCTGMHRVVEVGRQTSFMVLVLSVKHYITKSW